VPYSTSEKFFSWDTCVYWLLIDSYLFLLNILQCLPKTSSPHPATPAVPAPHSTGRHLHAAAEAPLSSMLATVPGPDLHPTEPARRGVNSHVPVFFICGGMGDACPLKNRKLCADVQYLDCAPADSCVRLSKWYWQVCFTVCKLALNFAFTGALQSMHPTAALLTALH